MPGILRVTIDDSLLKYCLGAQNLKTKKKSSTFKPSCQSLHFARITDMKRISKPQWAIEIYTFWQNLSTGDSRKESPLALSVSVRTNSACGPGDNLEPVITVMFPDED
jgi:hypothetical protein